MARVGAASDQDQEQDQNWPRLVVIMNVRIKNRAIGLKMLKKLLHWSFRTWPNTGFDDPRFPALRWVNDKQFEVQFEDLERMSQPIPRALQGLESPPIYFSCDQGLSMSVLPNDPPEEFHDD